MALPTERFSLLHTQQREPIDTYQVDDEPRQRIGYGDKDVRWLAIHAKDKGAADGTRFRGYRRGAEGAGGETW